MQASKITPMSRAVRLLQISDPHLFADPDGELRGVETLASMQRVLAAVRARALAVDAVLCTRRHRQRRARGLCALRARARRLRQAGLLRSRQSRRSRRTEARALPRPPFQVGGLRRPGQLAVGAGGQLHARPGGRPPQRAGAARLDAALAAAPVCDGVRASSSGYHVEPLARRGRHRQRGRLVPKCWMRMPMCALLSWGHVHQCFDDRRRGVRLLATPSTCAQFLPLSDQFCQSMLGRRPIAA